MAKRSKTHKFTYRVSFTTPLSRSEALYVVKDSGQMGKGASDYYTVWGDGNPSRDGEMTVRAIKLAKVNA